jgi:23S rRNA (cytosine1962-C5)-methyltransferase
MPLPLVKLKPGREKSVLRKHPWVFSGAVSSEDPEAECGGIVRLLSSGGEFLGTGTYHPRADIRVRLLTFGEEVFDASVLRSRILKARERRCSLGTGDSQGASRIVFGEGDGLSGLIIDRYAGHYSVQFLTAGMDRFRENVADVLSEDLGALSVFERSDEPGRRIDGLEPVRRELRGDTPPSVRISEGGILFDVDLRQGQKTGFFLDQAGNRDLIRRLSRNRRLLNLFSYTGGFTLAALKGGAEASLSVDTSSSALEALLRNAELNGFREHAQTVREDVFDFLDRGISGWDLIVIDPPAFAKKVADVPSASRGYKEVNLKVFKTCPPGALVLTCSCSRFISPDLFQKTVFGAALDSGRNAVLLTRTGHPPDHPVPLACPEIEYLKALLLRID